MTSSGLFPLANMEPGSRDGRASVIPPARPVLRELIRAQIAELIQKPPPGQVDGDAA